jgi:glycosyltransferase involved in cell wall biosynthesis
VRVAYLVSRFPQLSETFIVRELDAVEEHGGGVDLELLSLFPPPDEPTVHPRARRWVARLRRPTPARGALALLGWLARRPLRLLGSVLLVVRGYGREPGVLARALVTLPLAAAHARDLRRLGVDHVHAHFASHPALAAWLAWRLTGVPYSFTGHAYDLFKSQRFLARKARDARFVVAISDFNRRFIRSGAPDCAPIHVIHCGLDPGAYPFRPRDLDSSGPVRALCVAALREYKGHRVLLEALAGADGSLERVELDLVGGGELRKDLEERVRGLGLEGRVRFLGGRPEEEVRRLLAESDLFVLPSISGSDGNMEGLPVALMEALACGLPAVSTDMSGIPELVRDGHTGVLARPDDPSALRAALARVLADPAAARARSEAGRRLVEREFDIADAGRKLGALFAGKTP